MINHYIFEEKGIYYVNVARVIETTISFNKDKISEKEILNLDPETLFANSNYVMSGDEEDCIESFEFRIKVREDDKGNIIKEKNWIPAIIFLLEKNIKGRVYPER